MVDRDPLDLAATLRAVGAAAVDVVDEVDAGFFHRTLARWLGLAEGEAKGVQDPVRWDYGFWKATLEPLAKEGDKETWGAELHRDRDGPVECVSWFVVKDPRGRILRAGWLTAAPRLVDASAVADDAPQPLDAATMALLIDEHE